MLLKLAALRFWFGACLLLISTLAIAQQKTITGKVTSSDGKPVAGVTVAAKGTRLATQTNEDGAYSLSIPTNVSTLVFTSVGFQEQELAIANKENIDVSLSASTSSLSEVVV